MPYQRNVSGKITLCSSRFALKILIEKDQLLGASYLDTIKGILLCREYPLPQPFPPLPPPPTTKHTYGWEKGKC